MRDLLWPALASSLVAIVGFGSLFMLSQHGHQSRAAGRRVLCIRLGNSLSRILPGLRQSAFSHYTQSLFVRLVDDRRITITDPSETSTVIITTVGILVVCVGPDDLAPAVDEPGLRLSLRLRVCPRHRCCGSVCIVWLSSQRWDYVKGKDHMTRAFANGQASLAYHPTARRASD